MNIYLSNYAVDSAREALISVGAPFVSLSFHKIRKKKHAEKILKSIARRGSKVGITPGVCQLLKERGCPEEKLEGRIDNYCKEYIVWLKKHGGCFEFYTELDVGEILSYDKVKQYRKLFSKAGLKRDEKLLPIFYDSIPNSTREFEKLCSGERKYKYVAIDGRIPEQRINYLLEIAKKYKTKVHGFAMANIKYLTKIPFYSVDTSTWRVGSKYGKTLRLVGNSVDTIDNKRIRRSMMNDGYFRKYRINWESVFKDSTFMVDKMNAATVIEYGKNIDKAHKERKWTYWDKKTNKPFERDPAFEKNKGKIAEIMKRPEAKAKWLVAMKGNKNAFRHGRMAKLLPAFCNNCPAKYKCQYSPFNETSPYYDKNVALSEKPPDIYCYLNESFSKFFKPEEFKLREVKKVEEAREMIMGTQMTRAARNYYFELLDGGYQDKALTYLMTWIYERLTNVPRIDVNIYQNMLYQTAQDVREKFTDEKREALIEALGVQEGKIVEPKKKKAKT